MADELGVTLLLVEPDPLARDLAQAALRGLEPDVTVVTVADGVEALAQAAQARPQAVGLNLLLPRLSGLETIRQLRQQLGPACPILAISALGLREVVQQARAAGASDFIVRPYRPEYLAARVRGALAAPRPKPAQL